MRCQTLPKVLGNPLSQEQVACRDVVDTRVSEGRQQRFQILPCIRQSRQQRINGRLDRHFISRRLGEHRGKDERVERFVDRRSGIPGISDVRRPVQSTAEDTILVARGSLRVIVESSVEVGNRRREAGLPEDVLGVLATARSCTAIALHIAPRCER